MLEPLMPEAASLTGAIFTESQHVLDERMAHFLSVAPPILLQVVFLSPLPAVKQFRDTGTTGNVSMMPYTMMVANGTLWFTYGALLSNPTIMLPNITAIVMGTGYCAAFWRYRSPQASVAPYVGASASICALVIGSAMILPPADAKSVIGYLGCGVCAAMFAGPLASMQSVLRDRSAASLPIGFTLFSTLNTTAWLGYGALVLHDPFIWLPNVLGLGSSLTQIGLIARFGTAPPMPFSELSSSSEPKEAIQIAEPKDTEAPVRSERMNARLRAEA